jgi:dUTP pyrophosphatase
MMEIKILNRSKNSLPSYSTSYSAGVDLRASLDKEMILEPFQRALIPTGIFLEIPVGFEAQVRPRSGLAFKNGITVLNSPGTIDSDYRGEVGVILINLSEDKFVINNGDRIAQMVFAKHESIVWREVAIIEETERNAGGFGHTGKN